MEKVLRNSLIHPRPMHMEKHLLREDPLNGSQILGKIRLHICRGGYLGVPRKKKEFH